MTTKTASILGLDTADGAYLARLLLARGYRLSGTGGTGLLARLGIANHIATSDPDRIDEVYDLRFAAAGVPGLLESTGRARVFVAIPGTEPVPATIAAARAAGRFVVGGQMFDRESRLGPGTGFVARIVAAVFDDADPVPADLAAAADCGWTPEYVDPMWRMLQRSAPADFVLATGRALGGHEVARHAFAYFGRDATRFGNGAATGAVTGDPGPARTELGWSAVTWGRDLVRTLCEGIAEEQKIQPARA